jgi:hypothetical protein
MPHGPSLKELQETFLFCNVLPVAHKTADGNYERGQKKAEKTEIGATMRDVMWALTLAPPVKQPANIRVVITRFAPTRDVLQPAACATTISTTSFFGPLRFTLYAIHSANKARGRGLHSAHTANIARAYVFAAVAARSCLPVTAASASLLSCTLPDATYGRR